MHLTSSILFLSVVSTCQMMAGTVVITSVPDSQHALQPLTSLEGVPLAAGTQVLVGAFPGLTDDQVLDLASPGGLSQITAAFVPFGDPCTVGQGVDGAAGGFEIAVKASGSTPPWAGQIVSLLIKNAGGSQFLVARFPGKIFETQSATGLEPLLSLHLADAKVIVGSRGSASQIATSTTPSVGSFSTWLSGFSAITDPALKLPNADADSDGRSNFLEYATGGDPSSSTDTPPCWIAPDAEGTLWVRFKRVTGIGSIHYSLQSSATLGPPWVEAPGTLEPDPESPDTLRTQVLQPSDSSYYRLNVESAP